jgi:hypothetical protein
MRASEILRRMADLIDGKETGGEGTEIGNRPVTGAVDTAPAMDTAGIEGQAQVNTKSMTPPLQQKLELLKKVAGQESAFGSDEDICPECQCQPCDCGDHNELDIIKRNAGLPVVVQLASADNDIED